jgi:hypothetical protein
MAVVIVLRMGKEHKSDSNSMNEILSVNRRTK